MALPKSRRSGDGAQEIDARSLDRFSIAIPWATPAAIAEASVQPVPWVARVRCAGLLEDADAITRQQHVTDHAPAQMAALHQRGVGAECRRALSRGVALIVPTRDLSP